MDPKLLGIPETDAKLVKISGKIGGPVQPDEHPNLFLARNPATGEVETVLKANVRDLERHLGWEIIGPAPRKAVVQETAPQVEAPKTNDVGPPSVNLNNTFDEAAIKEAMAELAALRAEAETLGISYDDRTGKASLEKAIAAAKGIADPNDLDTDMPDEIPEAPQMPEAVSAPMITAKEVTLDQSVPVTEPKKRGRKSNN